MQKQKKSKKEGRTEWEKSVEYVKFWAGFYAKCYDMEYEDVEAQAYLIYCMAVQNYRIGKASFLTYLYSNLHGRLRDYCREFKNKTWQDESIDDLIKADSTAINFDEFFSKNYTYPPLDVFLEFAKGYLSSNAYELLVWASQREYEDDERVTIHSDLQGYFCDIKRWKVRNVYTAWVEVMDFWRSGVLAKLGELL